MQLTIFKIKSTSFTQLELNLFNLAKAEIKNGITVEKLKSYLVKELASYQEKIAKYRNAPTSITSQGRVVILMHHAKVLVVFEPLA